MKKEKDWLVIKTGALAITAAMLLSGCRNYIVFNTSTKCGLDISLKASQEPEVTFGYDRAELVSMPLSRTNSVGDASETNDAYSVVGAFGIDFNAGVTGTNKLVAGVRVHDLFATGIAARMVSTNEALGLVWGSLARQASGQASNTTNKSN